MPLSRAIYFKALEYIHTKNIYKHTYTHTHTHAKP